MARGSSSNEPCSVAPGRSSRGRYHSQDACARSQSPASPIHVPGAPAPVRVHVARQPQQARGRLLLEGVGDEVEQALVVDGQPRARELAAVVVALVAVRQAAEVEGAEQGPGGLHAAQEEPGGDGRSEEGAARHGHVGCGRTSRAGGSGGWSPRCARRGGTGSARPCRAAGRAAGRRGRSRSCRARGRPRGRRPSSRTRRAGPAAGPPSRAGRPGPSAAGRRPSRARAAGRARVGGAWRGRRARPAPPRGSRCARGSGWGRSPPPTSARAARARARPRPPPPRGRRAPTAARAPGGARPDGRDAPGDVVEVLRPAADRPARVEVAVDGGEVVPADGVGVRGRPGLHGPEAGRGVVERPAGNAEATRPPRVASGVACRGADYAGYVIPRAFATPAA